MLKLFLGNRIFISSGKKEEGDEKYHFEKTGWACLCLI